VSSWRSRRRRAGHLLVEALVAAVLLSLTLAALASGEVASRRSLSRGIEDLEMVRAATERLEYLRAQSSDSPAWVTPSSGPVGGHPEWTWSITPRVVEDRNVRGVLTSLRYLSATVIITAPDGRTVKREALRW
jgi:hypothetical protein